MQGQGVMITLSSGHVLNLFYHSDRLGYSSGMNNPDIVLA
nr:K338 [uncultured bacterium]